MVLELPLHFFAFKRVEVDIYFFKLDFFYKHVNILDGCSARHYAADPTATLLDGKHKLPDVSDRPADSGHDLVFLVGRGQTSYYKQFKNK